MALYEAHRQIVSPRKRGLLADAAAFLLRKRNGLLFQDGADSAANEAALRLASEGLVPLDPVLTTEQLEQLINWLAPQFCRDPYEPNGQRYLASQTPPQLRLGQYTPSVIVRAPYLLQLANEPRVLAIAEKFLGAKPTISNLSLWWSFATGQTPQEAQLFHRDVDDLRFCKLFVYLTEVDMNSGPHVFVKGSPPSEQCCQIKRYPDDEIVQAFGKDALTYLCGEPGSAFLANTSGVHKGMPPTKQRRLLFQAEYSLFPIMCEEYDPISVIDLPFAPDPYVNRLYLKSARDQVPQ